MPKVCNMQKITYLEELLKLLQRYSVHHYEDGTTKLSLAISAPPQSIDTPTETQFSIPSLDPELSMSLAMWRDEKGG